MRLNRTTAALAVAALTLSACAGDDPVDDVAAEVDETTDEVVDDAEELAEDMEEGMDDMAEDMEEGMDDMADDMDMDGMDMGSADGERADEADADELREGEFVLLDSAPDAFAAASGTAWLALGPMTWLTAEVEGLAPGTEVVGHLHAESCATSGGPHFMFDAEGEATPPNEVHVAATADDEGAFTVSVTNEMVASDAMSLVLHAKDGDTTKALCADLAA